MSFNSSAAREPLFTEKEAAAQLRISPSYLRLLRAQKRISCYKFGGFGGRVAYAESHIENFKRSHEQQACAIAA
jgi:hypothetical protein